MLEAENEALARTNVALRNENDGMNTMVMAAVQDADKATVAAMESEYENNVLEQKVVEMDGQMMQVVADAVELDNQLQAANAALGQQVGTVAAPHHTASHHNMTTRHQGRC